MLFLSLSASSLYSVDASWNSLCQDEATLRASLDVERSLIAELAAELALLLTYYCCCGLLDRNATLESRARLENSLHLHF